MIMSTIIENYEDVLTTLVELKMDSGAKCSSTASTLTRAIEKFEFIVCLVSNHELLYC